MSEIWCVQEHQNPTNSSELMRVGKLSEICEQNERALQVGHPTQYVVVAYFDSEEAALAFEQEHRAEFLKLHPRVVKKLGQFG